MVGVYSIETIMKDQSAREKNSSAREKSQNCTRETDFSTREKSQNYARETVFSTREKNQKSGRENCQKSGKKWARKPIFAREKSQNKTKKLLLGHFCRFSGKKKTLLYNGVFFFKLFPTSKVFVRPFIRITPCET